MVHKPKIKASYIKKLQFGPNIINLKIICVAEVCEQGSGLGSSYGKLLASYCNCEQPIHVCMFCIHQALEDSRAYDDRIRKEEEEKRKQEEEKRKQEKEDKKGVLQNGWESLFGKN